MTALSKAKSAEKKAAHLYNQGKIKAESAIEQGKFKIENLYDHGKESVNELLEGGQEKWQDTQAFFHNYSSAIVKSVKARPVTWLLAAGGIGCIIAAFLTKK